MSEKSPFVDLRITFGMRVRKVVGDYDFDGVVVAVFQKKNGLIRYVVENEAGILHIFSEKQLFEKATEDE
jgi:hypothetical protein